MEKVTGRFAPSPSGRMHLGNIYSALISWLSARSKGGEWILRIEDIDRGRSRQEWVDCIRDDLRWLGLTWDREYTQSERFAIYERELNRLKDQGLTYPCYCTRADIMATQAPHESDGRIVYQGTCRPAPGKVVVPPENGRRGATRLMVPDRDISFCDRHYGSQCINLAHHCGDFVLQRADGAWAYQLAVVVDDALMGVTEVVRGRDLLLSVPQQLYLYDLLGYSAPEFAHIPLLCNTEGQRLSKRDKSLDMGCLRTVFTPEMLLGKIASTLGILPPGNSITAEELLPLFSWSELPHDDIIIADL